MIMEQVMAEVKLGKFRDTGVHVESETAEDDDTLEVFEELDLAFEEGLAGTDFDGIGLIVGRSAANGGGDPGVVQD